MQVQDPIHGYIHLTDLEEAILDTPEMQRLRRVKQLGFSSLVYPSATHSRFEHSLGAMHLAGGFADALDVDDDRRQELRLAALCHDLGHGPFSHVTDTVFHEAGTAHETFSKRKVKASPIVDILADHGVDPDAVCALIDGKGTLGSIIAGHIDVDRMDYLMRDAHYTGVAYGTIDADTIIRAARIQDDRLVFDAAYITALESLLTARYLMMPTVYMHRASRIAERMFLAAYDRYAAAENVQASRLAAMDDPELLSRMRQCAASAPMIQRVENRDLYKIAARRGPEADIDALRDHVRDATGLGPDQVLADRIAMGGGDPYDVPILADGDRTALDAVSPLPAALRSALDANAETRLYVPRDVQDEARDALP